MREDVTFPSGSDSCAAWLYRPSGSSPDARIPLVVMAHGLGAVRTMRLDAYAERFAAAGFAALVFDYRYFGDSGGEPRQLLSVPRQLEDYAAAIAYARSLPGIDPDRIIAWGSSFSGGHVLRVGAKDRRIAAVISQCPFTNGLSSSLALGVRSTLKVAPLAIADEVAALRKKTPRRVALVGPPGSAALMTAPDAMPGYLALKADGTEPDITVAARIGTRIGLNYPGRAAKKLACPALILVCEKDTVAPSGPTLKAVAKAPRGEVIRYPLGHFDVYTGEAFERSSGDMVAFLQRHFG